VGGGGKPFKRVCGAAYLYEGKLYSGNQGEGQGGESKVGIKNGSSLGGRNASIKQNEGQEQFLAGFRTEISLTLEGKDEDRS